MCLKISRCGGISRPARRRPRSCARRAPTSTSPRPSTARSGSRPRVHCAAALRADRRRAGWRRSRCSPTSSTVLAGRRDGAIAVPRRRPGSASGRSVARRPSLGRAVAAATAGRLARQAVAGARDDGRRAPGSAAAIRSPSARTSRRARRRRSSPGIVELAEPVPQRLHRAGADAAQDGGQRARVVAQQVRAPDARRPRGGVPANSGCAAPALGERLDRRALGAGGEASSAARRAARCAGVLDAGGASRRARGARRAPGAPSATCRAIRPPIE